MRTALVLALACAALPLSAQESTPAAGATAAAPAPPAPAPAPPAPAPAPPAPAPAPPAPAPAPPAPAPASPAAAAPPSTVTQLPAISGASRYGAPAALPPVTAQLFHVGGLFEVQPFLAVSVGDPFWRTLGVGLRAEQHLDERWSVAGHAIAALSLLSAPVEVCGDTACSNPGTDQLRSTPGKLPFQAGLELGWAPIYGKLSLIGEQTVHFDAYLAAGPEVVQERIAQDQASPESGRWAFGGRFSLGERLFLGNRFVLRVAASELVYAGRVRGTAQVERKLSFEGGVSWLFGGGR